MNYNVLALSHFDKNNAIFEDYCNGIKNASDTFHYVDYVELYIQRGKSGFETYLFNLVIQLKINFVFIIIRSGDLTFDLFFLKRLADVTKLVFNFFDTEHYFDAVDKYYGQEAFLVLLPNYLPKYRFELLGINALCTFSLYDKARYKKYERTVRDIDISFVGNVVKCGRTPLMSFLSAHNIVVEQFGRGSSNGLITFEEMIAVFNRSKINLNFNASADNAVLILGENINNRIMQIKGRINEIVLCGGFVLTEYSPGIEQMYEIGKEIDVFCNKHELLEKVRYYLTNDTEREAMADAARTRALGKYDTNEVFDWLLNHYLPGLVNTDDGKVLSDTSFEINYSLYRTFYLVNFLARSQFRYAFGELCQLLKIPMLLTRTFKKVPRFLFNGVSLYLSQFPALKARMKSILKIKIRGD